MEMNVANALSDLMSAGHIHSGETERGGGLLGEP